VGDLGLYWAVIETAGIVIGIWVLETIIVVRLERPPGTRADGQPGPAGARKWRSLMIGGCLTVVIWLTAVVAPVRLWLVERFNVLSAAQWDRYSGSAVGIVATLYIAYLLARAVFAGTDRSFELPSPVSPAAHQTDAMAPIASRLQTMLPLLKILAVRAIAIAAVLIALAELGVNTASLVAGASIFGLAISFG
jgi:hypothetical protein